MFWKTFVVTVCLFKLTQTADNCGSFDIESTVEPMKSMDRSSCINGKDFVLGTLQRTSWFRADNICRYNGMRLAVINCPEEQKAVTDLKDQSTHNSSGFWISGNDLACKKNWYWSSNGKPIKFFSWQAGEPNNAKKNERCIKLNPKKSMWNDDPCDSLNYFICEQKCVSMSIFDKFFKKIEEFFSKLIKH